MNVIIEFGHKHYRQFSQNSVKWSIVTRDDDESTFSCQRKSLRDISRLDTRSYCTRDFTLPVGKFYYQELVLPKTKFEIAIIILQSY